MLRVQFIETEKIRVCFSIISFEYVNVKVPMVLVHGSDTKLLPDLLVPFLFIFYLIFSLEIIIFLIYAIKLLFLDNLIKF